MNLVILGAGGRTGRLLVEQAVNAGHTVTAFVHSVDQMTTNNSNVITVVGDATNESDLAKAFAAQDAVISTLGSSKLKDTLIEQSTIALISAARSQNVRRVIMMSSFLVSKNFKPNGIIKFLTKVMQPTVNDKAAGEALLAQSDLDYTIVYATTLTNGPATGNYRIVGPDETVNMANSSSRADVADFLVKQLTDPTYVRSDVLITSK